MVTESNSGSAPLRWSHTAQAEPTTATTLRRRLRGWVLELGVNSALVDDIVLGVYEALANVVEHAYRASPEIGTMTITAAYDHETLTVTVSDTGTWHPPTPTTTRSHGLQLAAAVSDELSVDHRPGLGTVVTVAWSKPLAAARPSGSSHRAT
ncbi:anti-sigma regulatory factor [Rhodococcus sp. 14-2483-1-1]|nr:anti-sigma regulatory factor [Rhodococcus sp. WWJCD1]OZE88282.1 anti-sigma regulatory factor [Rhodococcus sp. 15-649-2-2]OZF40936.1 anti-sigma regulatory factor [Rhodococcus sp. 14-2483-1-1]QII03251.1 ATP-binding protein [Rhodococcus fascians A21d2]